MDKDTIRDNISQYIQAAAAGKNNNASTPKKKSSQLTNPALEYLSNSPQFLPIALDTAQLTDLATYLAEDLSSGNLSQAETTKVLEYLKLCSRIKPAVSALAKDKVGKSPSSNTHYPSLKMFNIDSLAWRHLNNHNF